MKNIHEAFEKNWENLVDHLDEQSREKVGLALHKLRESLSRLNYRYSEYETAQMNLYQAGENGEEPNFTICQERLVDRLEAFHQQVYSTISTLILVVNFLGVNGEKNHPINSVKRFLEYIILNIPNDIEIENSIDELLASISYRAKFVDHPQQQKLHNWMTFGYRGEHFVIYYIPKGREVYVHDNSHPRDPNFKPPVNCEEFMVNPDGQSVYKSVFDLVEYIYEFDFQEE